MHYTYILEHVGPAKHYYVGATSDLKSRLADHNAGRSPHTAKHRPWKLKWYCAFENQLRAETFETYLKSGSGREFQIRHIA